MKRLHVPTQVMEGALEVWDYSRYNIENYMRRVRKTQPRLQYVPFSFLHTKSSIPLGEPPPSPRQQDSPQRTTMPSSTYQLRL